MKRRQECIEHAANLTLADYLDVGDNITKLKEFANKKEDDILAVNVDSIMSIVADLMSESIKMDESVLLKMDILLSRVSTRVCVVYGCDEMYDVVKQINVQLYGEI